MFSVLIALIAILFSCSNVVVIVNTHTDPNEGTFHVEPDNTAAFGAEEVSMGHRGSQYQS